MNKTDLLLRMMEQPTKYTDREWQEIFADEECRELYTLMAKTRSALDVEKAEEQTTEEAVNAEWCRFERRHFPRHFSMAYRYAAMVVGILMLTGIAYAAIRFLSMPKQQVGEDLNAPTHEIQMFKNTASEPRAKNLAIVSDTIVPTSPRLFDNVPLEQILEELTGYYHIDVIFRNEKARKIRLFYQWKPEYTLEKVVEMLNNFETLHVTVENNTLIVSSEEQARP